MNKGAIKKGVEAREKILKAIISYVDKHKYPPTVRELCDITGYKSTNTVYSHIHKLLEDGLLETDHGIGSPRALRVPQKVLERGVT